MAGGSPARARHRARELLIKALYQWQIAATAHDELVAQFRARSEFARSDQQYFLQLLSAVTDDAAALDANVARYAPRGIDQLDTVGRTVLRLAFAELQLRRDVPVKVVINEAIELTKRYGAKDSFRFVNAVLDKAARTIRSNAQASDGSSVTAGAGGGADS